MRTRVIAIVLVTTFLSSVCSGAEVQKPVLISGYDDVLRQANNTGILRSAKRLFAKDETFAGMPELYRILAERDSNTGFVVVSATSSMFAAGAGEFLKEAGYPSSMLYFRSWLTQWSAEKFKHAQIEQLMSARPGRKFVFVLDNSATSIDLSGRLLREHAASVSVIYLRETVQRSAIPSTVSFITSFDIAANEFAEGRVKEDELVQVAMAIVAEQQSFRIVPEYSHCPVDYDPCNRMEPKMSGKCADVRLKVRAICESRQTH